MVYDNRRARARRAGPPPPPPPPPPPSSTGGTRTVSFNIPLQCQGTLTLFDYRSEATQVARVEFQCAVPGVVQIYVDGQQVLRSRTVPGRVAVNGIFMPAGSFVQVHFTNEYDGGRLAGHITIGPAPESEALAAARSMFGLTTSYTLEELTRAHRRLVLRHHPDRGGDTAKMAEVNHYYDLLKAKFA